MDPIEIALQCVLIPAVLAGIVLACAWRAWKRDSQRDGRPWGALAIALAFASTFYFLSGLPTSLLPDSPRTPTGLDWLAWMTFPAALLLPLEAKLGKARHILRGVVAAIVVRLVLRNAFASIWEAQEGWIWFGVLTALYLAIWAAIARSTSRRPGASSPMLLWLLATGLAVLAGLTGSALIAQLTGALAAGFGAAIVISWRIPRFSLSGSGSSMGLLLLFALGLNAHFFSYTTGTDILLLAAAPFAALLAELPPLRFKRPALRTLTVLALASIPIAVALTRAAMAFLAEAEDDYYDY